MLKSTNNLALVRVRFLYKKKIRLPIFRRKYPRAHFLLVSSQFPCIEAASITSQDTTTTTTRPRLILNIINEHETFALGLFIVSEIMFADRVYHIASN